jgi:outer membrane protein OmpA-like peptidoglycan-associated protein
MALNFLDTVKSYFNGEFSNQAANSLDESGSGVAAALSALVPTGLAGILNKATSGAGGADEVFNLATGASKYLHSSPNLSDLHNDEKGSNIPSLIFGNNQSGVASAISHFTGIKNSSAASLMTMALPAIMGLLGKHAEQNNLTASGLSGFLSSQKDHIMQAMPAGLSSLAGMLGFQLPASAASMSSNIKSGLTEPAAHRIDPTHPVVEKPARGKNWLVPLVVIVAAVAMLIYFSRSCSHTTPNNTVDTNISDSVKSDATVTPPAPVATTTPESIKVKLPNGKELDAYKGGIENQLVTFLNSDWKSLSADSLKNRWFNFDNLNFSSGNATLLPESEKQLDNIAEILKAFPDAKIKIGGYTDVTGNAAANKKLSQDRADVAKTGLTKRGVGKQVTGSEGYGSEFAKYPATATEEEKVLDRHVSVSVRK